MASGWALARARLAWLLALLLAAPSAAEPRACSSEQQVGLSFAYSTNSTGHPQLKVHVEQPIRRLSWLLDVNLGTVACGASGTQRTILDVTLGGSPLTRSLGNARAIPPGYTFLPAYGHYRRPETAMNWEAARDLCNSEGASLLLPKTVQEINSLLALFPTNVTGTFDQNFAWVGSSDLAQEGIWISVKNEPLDQATNIPANELNDGRGHNCLLYKKTSGQLHDYECRQSLAFYCKWDSEN